jgi:hypothetical protein
MDIRVVMQGIAVVIRGLSALWFGLGLFFAVILWIGDFFSPGAMEGWKDPGANLLWSFALPALVGLLLAGMLANVGRRNA